MKSICRPDSIVLASLLALLVPLSGLEAIQGSDLEGDDPASTVVDRNDGTAQEGALFLLLPLGAQGVAMGRAMSAIQTSEGAFWNPAGLADLDRSRILVYRGDQLAGETVAVSALLARPGVGTLGLSYQLLDVGSQDLTDEQGNTVGSVSVRNHLAVLSFATEIVPRMETGLNLKMVQFRVTCRGACQDDGVTATTYAVDAGLQGRPTDRLPLRLGAMIAHLGPALQVVNAEQADPLPTRMRLSGAYELLGHFVDQQNREIDLWFTMEVEDRWRDPGDPSLYVGSEFSAGRTDVIYVRAGYALGEVARSDGAAVGMGLRYERFDLGIAKSLGTGSLQGEAEPIHVTFGLLF